MRTASPQATPTSQRATRQRADRWALGGRETHFVTAYHVRPRTRPAYRYEGGGAAHTLLRHSLRYSSVTVRFIRLSFRCFQFTLSFRLTHHGHGPGPHTHRARCMQHGKVHLAANDTSHKARANAGGHESRHSRRQNAFDATGSAVAPSPRSGKLRNDRVIVGATAGRKPRVWMGSEDGHR